MKLVKQIPSIVVFGIIIIAIFLVALVVKGQKGSPLYFQKERDTKVEGPFESTGSTSRYALVQSIVDNHTFFFTPDLASFSAPDVVLYKGHSFSIFTPGVSFLAAPFYIFGEKVGLPQLFAYLSTALFALINMLLIARIANKLGAGLYASLVSGFLFLFATNGLTYALTLTQHQLTITIILLALLNAFGERTILKDILFGLILGFSPLVDIPDVIFLMPIFIYIFCKHFTLIPLDKKIQVNFKLTFFSILLGMIPFLIVFLYYNYQTTGSLFKVGQTVGRGGYVTSIAAKTTKKVIGPPPAPSSTNVLSTQFLSNSTFNTRVQLNGLYILLLSDERGIFYYSPILLIGLFGLFIGLRQHIRKNKNIFLIIFAIILTNIAIYSMFDDPWGGWAFGPRYLLPTIALLSTTIGIALQKYKRNRVFLVIVCGLLFYSVWISSLGALTTSAVPPKQEAEHLIVKIPYTYQYNLSFITKNATSSLVYNLFLSRQMTVKTYMYVFDVLIILVFGGLLIGVWFEQKERSLGR